ncbi:exinuclease ABC system, subunit C [Gottschalkia acidurici 9a]|uniref:UvrABC system protein C n=1 Tax=Gottschalkia acidurici (strain ATCC 7906 / DSM 604 / BCRC 14475 / CIP 104303 / KCTC 5404 / NCIMB 10678 / 9a) TaxID=1128398 RepID=K0B0H7_GOTA9|nr:excinuclease ABC subunit UvrC [Gottschalkia acidurici]AFS79039.1 exinuclease ABC system, subunit C [Gottschalkia acidurici 9a]
MFNINDELKKLPDKPGVYIMKNSENAIIYVGKAISLKKRVRQYFQSSKNHPPKVNAMVKNIIKFEYIITDNEVEALILESNLIKKHKPKYNILLRDDKSYPYIKVTVNEKYPRVIKTRNIVKDGSKYFGPYVSSGAVNDTLEIIDSLYKLRTCKMNLNDGPKLERPCLNNFIGKCLGPCYQYVDHEEYKSMIDEVIMFLNGKEQKLVEIIEKKMKNASKGLDFESAAKYRDQLVSLNHILEKQKIVSTTNISDQDIIGMARGIDEVCIQVFFIRTGKVMGREHFIIKDTDDIDRGEIIQSFVKQFYIGTSYVPKEILVGDNFEDIEVVGSWLSSKRGSKVNIKIPKRGEKNELMELVRKNAIEILNQRRDRVKKKTEDTQKPLVEIAEALKLERVPNRIEAFDISNTQGVQSVASMVVFENGEAKTREYRKFKIKWVEGPDDYSSMEEVIYRRFSRGLEEKKLISENKVSIENFSIFPELIMIDGGKGQVNVAKRVLKKLGIDIPVCGLIKDDFHRTRGIIYEDEEITLPLSSSGFKLITKIQDEAHRFAITYHRNLRTKDLVKSVLDSIPGVGEKRKKNLLKEFKTIENIKKATIEEISSVDGMNKKVAEEIYNFFRKN